MLDGDLQLRAICVGAGIGHGQNALQQAGWVRHCRLKGC